MKKKYLPQTWVDSRLYIDKSPIHDRGVFAAEEIQEGEKLMEWGGVVIKKSEYVYDESKINPSSVVPISETEFLGIPATVATETIDEYLNHSCDPNSWLIDEVTVVARRKINPGKEITLDCVTWDDGEIESYSDDGKCSCGAEKCRIVLHHDDWKKPELQKRYAGHFSPFIQKRIEEFRAKKEQITSFYTLLNPISTGQK